MSTKQITKFQLQSLIYKSTELKLNLCEKAILNYFLFIATVKAASYSYARITCNNLTIANNIGSSERVVKRALVNLTKLGLLVDNRKHNKLKHNFTMNLEQLVDNQCINNPQQANTAHQVGQIGPHNIKPNNLINNIVKDHKLCSKSEQVELEEIQERVIILRRSNKLHSSVVKATDEDLVEQVAYHVYNNKKVSQRKACEFALNAFQNGGWQRPKGQVKEQLEQRERKYAVEKQKYKEADVQCYDNIFAENIINNKINYKNEVI